MALLDGWLTVLEVAQRVGVDPETVRRHIRFGKLPARKYHGVWLVSEEVAAHCQKDPRPGEEFSRLVYRPMLTEVKV